MRKFGGDPIVSSADPAPENSVVAIGWPRGPPLIQFGGWFAGRVVFHLFH
jgi:hypothetical protein